MKQIMDCYYSVENILQKQEHHLSLPSVR